MHFTAWSNRVLAPSKSQKFGANYLLPQLILVLFIAWKFRVFFLYCIMWYFILSVAVCSSPGKQGKILTWCLHNSAGKTAVLGDKVGILLEYRKIGRRSELHIWETGQCSTQPSRSTGWLGRNKCRKGSRGLKGCTRMGRALPPVLRRLWHVKFFSL